MPDVAIKLFSGRVTYNGSAVVTADKLGNSGSTNVIHPANSATTNQPNASGLANSLELRFDDRTYYSA